MTNNRLYHARQALLLACATLAVMPAAANAQIDTSVEFNIAAQDLDEALAQLARQSNREIYFPADIVRGRRAQPIQGQLSVEEALNRLLVGTTLGYRIKADGAIVVEAGGGAGAGEFDAGQGPAASASAEEDDREIVVTGSRIAGAASASPVISITRADIERSGYSTVTDVIRSLPQSFAGGQNPGVVGSVGNANVNNFSQSASANLRGLGPDATLTLIDGRRSAYDGINNDVDISVIPLAAVSRIEVLTDSASALYGSDAVAGVVNFIMRDDYDGAETLVRYGDSTRGGGAEWKLSQLLGRAWATGGAMINFEHREQSMLKSDERAFSQEVSDPTTLIPEHNSENVYARLHQELMPGLRLEIQGLYGQRDGRQFISYQGYTFENNSRSRQRSLNGGISFDLPAGWQADIFGTWSQNDQRFRSEAIAGPRDSITAFKFDNKIFVAESGARGPLFDLGAGPVSLAVGAGYRSETFVPDYIGNTGGEREVRYAYGELRVPLVAPDPERAGLARLELALAARHEDYSDFGSIATPKVGGIYEPFNGLRLRASWGEAFRAPALLDLYGRRAAHLWPAAMLEITNAPSQTVLIRGEANRKLRPETAESLSVGFDYSPSWLPGARVSLTYFDLDYKDRIAQVFDKFNGAIGQPRYAPFIDLTPTPAEINALLADADEFRAFGGAVLDPATVMAIFYAQKTNATAQKINGVDLAVDYQFGLTGGEMAISANAAWLKIGQQVTLTLPETEITGTIFNPPDFKLRGSAAWSKDGFSIVATVNHIGSFIDNSAGLTPTAIGTGQPIASWTTVDGQISYDFGERRGLLDKLRLAVAVQNLFDVDPPRVQSGSVGEDLVGLGYDAANASPLGRFVSLTVSKAF